MDFYNIYIGPSTLQLFGFVTTACAKTGLLFTYSCNKRDREKEKLNVINIFYNG